MKEHYPTQEECEEARALMRECYGQAMGIAAAARAMNITPKTAEVTMAQLKDMRAMVTALGGGIETARAYLSEAPTPEQLADMPNVLIPLGPQGFDG